MNSTVLTAFGLLCATSVTAIVARPPESYLRVESFPSSIELDGRFRYAQLVLTGVRDDGSRVDVTREATVADLCDLITLDDRGLVRPLRDGKGELHLQIGGIDLRLPVHVSGFDTAGDIGFTRDVAPLLTRAGCNAGTCHGSGSGKNGFKLSLRGYDPAADHAALTDDLAGRRFDRAQPASSLFLLKPTASVPHEGGRVIDPEGHDYATLRAWVEGGVRLDAHAPHVASIELFPSDPTISMPGSEQQFAVIATYDDGSRRDVSAHAFVETGNTEVVEVGTRGLIRTLRRGEAAILARFEGQYAATRLFVMGDRTGFEWSGEAAANYIDELVDARLREIRTLPSPTCTDEDFLRRVHLDLTGLPPTPGDVEAFTLDARESMQKRAEVVDRLIGSTEFVRHWTNRWCDLLQVNPKFLGDRGAEALRDWVHRAVASNLPYDEFVRALLDSSGSTIANPPAAYYKILRKPDVVMENTTQLFLGVRFSCNKCHDHPFERWTQRQHWQLAAYFADVTREDVPGSDKMPKSTVMEKGEEPPAYEEIIGDGTDGTVHDPNGREYTSSFPFESAPMVADGSPRRAQLAHWLTSAANPYFARSYVNRLWSYLLGIGLIEPVDDIRASNPATHPALLDRLTAEFVDGGFDMRIVLRRVCTSRTYQRSIASNEWNDDDDVHYAKARARRLPAEVLFDAVHRATGVRSSLPGARPGTRARDLVGPGVETPDGFLDLFGRPPRESACECERTDGVSLGQALNLVNGPTLADAIQHDGGAIAELVEYESDDAQVVEALYLRFLCRKPTASECDALVPSFDPLDIGNLAALPADAAAELARRQAEWEAGVATAEWHVVEPGNQRAESGNLFKVLDDRSVLATGTAAERDVYEFVGRSELGSITGIRIEVLPDPSFPKNGPGRSESGNFVLAHLTGSAIPLGDVAAGRPLRFTAATADFSQDGWPVERAIVDDDKGWGIHPDAGKPHVAVFELGEDVGAVGGTLIVLRMQFPFGSSHLMGRFRVAVTGSPRPVRFSSVPDDVATALRSTGEQRDAAQRALLHRAYFATDGEMRERIRLSAAQDLAWALATSPAFLFNR